MTEPGENQTQGADAASLLDTISQHALDATGGDVWRAGQPLATPDQPTAAPVQPDAPAAGDGGGSSPPPSKPDEASVLSRLEPLLGGKYTSIDEAEKGIHQLLADRTAEREGRQAAEAELARVRSAVTTNGQPPPEAAPDPLSELEMLGFPKDAIEKAIRQTIKTVVAEEAKPYNERISADQAIIAKYPKYQERFGDLQEWLKANPEIEGQVLLAENAGHFTLAREFAWLQFDRDNAGKTETKGVEEAAKAAEKRAEARSDARTFKPSQTTEVRTPPVEDRKIVKRDELDRLTQLAKDGYEAPLWRRTIGETLPKEVFPDSN